MAAPQLKTAAPNRLFGTVKALLRNRITSGLFTILPIWITILLVKFIFGVMRGSSEWVVHLFVSNERLVARVRESLVPSIPTGLRTWVSLGDAELATAVVQWTIAIFSVLLTVFILYVIGLFTANIVGRRILQWLESIVDRLPLIKTVYRSSKQILQQFSGGQTQAFQKVVLAPFPNKDVRTPGFLTNTFRDAVTGEELCSVFFFTVPNPTTGYVVVMKRADLIDVDWSIEDAIKMMMSAGTLIPSPMSLAESYPATGGVAARAPSALGAG
ncbi:MAG: hypothetical protein CHACPFDD_01285 [Phycisphaerae bacterium]|nr:hypothetical protein [Phycisphaerae bacterium]